MSGQPKASAVTPERVSVVVPVHNSAAYLGEALESAISQKPAPLEIVVVDDHCRDDSVAIAESFGERVRVVVSDGRGAGAARNCGVLAARGAFLAFLDSDDRWKPHALANLCRALESQPGTGIAYGRAEEFCSPDIPPALQPRLQARPGRNYSLCPGTFLFRASTFREVGLINIDLRAGEIIDWLARLRSLGFKEAFSEELVLERRIHAGHLGPEKQASRSDLLRVVRSALARRRSGDGLPGGA